jgi:hypothetical protein
MADPLTSSAAASAASAVGGVLAMPVLAVMGMDITTLGWALVGVVIVQTLLPNTTQGIKAVIILAIGSMLFAALAAPFLAPAVHASMPSWSWLQQVPPEHIKSVSAAITGGFAQPILLGLRAMAGRWLPVRTLPPPDAAPEPPKE